MSFHKDFTLKNASFLLHELPNPGKSGAGGKLILKDQTISFKQGTGIDTNYAELESVLTAVILARENNIKQITILSDS